MSRVDLSAPHDNSGDHKKSRNSHSFINKGLNNGTLEDYGNGQYGDEEGNRYYQDGTGQVYGSMANNNYDANSGTFDTSKYEKDDEKGKKGENNKDNNKEGNGQKDGQQKKSSPTGGGKSDNKKSDIKLRVEKAKKMFPIIVIAAAVLALLGLFVALFGGSKSSATGAGSASGGYYRSGVKEVTVITTQANGAVTTATYPINDYVAGVVSAEASQVVANVGGTTEQKTEVYKALAIIARASGYSNISDGAIENGGDEQKFEDITNKNTPEKELIYQAVEDTNNVVLLEDDDLVDAKYDEFAFQTKDANYYTLVQKDQKIPTSWVEAHVTNEIYKNCPSNLRDGEMTECWDSEGNWLDGGDGEGLSIYGALYLAEQGYTYDKIINYYYGEEVTISRKGYMSSIPNLELKLTGDGEILEGTRLADFLDEQGDSIENLNAYIHDNVEEVGAGTREGVVVAAVSLINYMYDGYHKKLPYWFGGVYQQIGASPNWGGVRNPDYYGYIYDGFDCAAFTSWTIINGGFNFTKRTTAGFGDMFNKNSCLLMDDDCIGQPGDFINSRYGHIELILAVDEEAGIYWLAHSGSESSGIYIKTEPLHRSRNSGSSTAQEVRILFMEDFYSNPANVNQNY